MTLEEFDKYLDCLIEKVKEMKTTKGKEYANSEDRFANFRRLSAELDIPDYQIGWVYCKKHLDSIAQFLRTGQTHSNEPILGRFVDAITYLTLIAGMVAEAHEPKSKAQVVTSNFNNTNCNRCGEIFKAGELILNSPNGLVHITNSANVCVRK